MKLSPSLTPNFADLPSPSSKFNLNNSYPSIFFISDSFIGIASSYSSKEDCEFDIGFCMKD